MSRRGTVPLAALREIHVMDDKRQAKKYRLVSVYITLFILVSILCLVFALKIWSVFAVIGYITDALLPVIIGLIIAYLLMPAVRFFERKVLVRMIPKYGRSRVRLLAVTLSFVIMFVVLILIAILLIPQLLSNYTELAGNIGGYIEAAQDFADNIIGTSTLFGDSSTLTEVLGADLDVFLGGVLVDSLLFADRLVSSIVTVAGSILDIAVNTVFSLICAFGIMLYSDKLKKYTTRITEVVLTPRRAEGLYSVVRLFDRAFGGFFSGRIFESLLIGLISLVVFYVTGMPYPPLLAVILAVFNLIPYFGSIFAGLVGGVIVLVDEPSKLIWFLVIDLVMEQIDGNILAPRVLGDTIGMHPLFIFVSITVMGNLLGVLGLIIGVPIAAVLIELVKYLCKRRESARAALTNDKESEVSAK